MVGGHERCPGEGDRRCWENRQAFRVYLGWGETDHISWRFKYLIGMVSQIRVLNEELFSSQNYGITIQSWGRL